MQLSQHLKCNALHRTTWEKLLATDKQIFLRNLNKHRRFKSSLLLVGIATNDSLNVKPSNGHAVVEVEEMKEVRVWKSRTVNNPAGGLPEDQLMAILMQDPNYSEACLADDSEIEGEGEDDCPSAEDLAKLVIMDRGFRQFYMGSANGTFSTDLDLAQKYEPAKAGDARKSMARMNPDSPRFKFMISENGVELVTVQEALAYLEEMKKNDAENFPSARPAVMADGFAAGVAVNPPVGKVHAMRKTAEKNGSKGENGHKANGGRGNWLNDVLPGLVEQKQDDSTLIGLSHSDTGIVTHAEYDAAIARRNKAIETLNEAEQMRIEAFNEMIRAQQAVDSIVQQCHMRPTAMLEQLLTTLSQKHAAAPPAAASTQGRGSQG